MARTLFIGAFGRGLALVVTLFLARWFGADAWGAASAARALTELPLFFARGGAEQRILKVCAGDIDGRLNDAQEVAGAMQILLLGAMTVGITLYYVAPGSKTDPSVVVVFAVAAALYAPLQLKVVWEAIVGRTRALVTDNVILHFLRGVFSILSSAWLAGSLAIAVGYLLAVAVSTIAHGRQWLRRPRVLSRDSVFETADLGTNYVLAGVMSRLDLLIVSAALGATRAGAYALLQGVCSLTSIVGQAQGRVVGPIIGAGLKKGDLEVALRRLSLVQRSAAIVSIPLTYLIVSIAPALSAKMGLGFEFDSSLALPVCLSFSVSAVFSYEGYLLSLSGRQSTERKLLIGYAIAIAIGAIAGSQLAGLLGVAVAVFLASVIVAIARRSVIAMVFGQKSANVLAWPLKSYVGITSILLVATAMHIASRDLGLLTRIIVVMVISCGAGLSGLAVLLDSAERSELLKTITSRFLRQ